MQRAGAAGGAAVSAGERRPRREAIGALCWAIPEGYIPGSSTGEGPAFESHETACILNASDRDAHVEIVLLFSDRDPVGPYRLTVAARRTQHVRFNDLEDPEPVPRDTDFASVIESDVPIVVQHTRLDSRQAALALLSTVAFAADGR
ncbi:MAG: sensory rhodopsin transducer [Gammaproteobacteria bacterium]|nr:sensory rhodopsin transducer [Gammaproteobacteria bacterium]